MKNKNNTVVVYRNSINGQFTTEKFAKKYPNEMEKERLQKNRDRAAKL